MSTIAWFLDKFSLKRDVIDLNLKGTRALVTGGAGFIGSHLVETLLNREVNVTVFDNLSTGRLENIESLMHSKSLSLKKGDLINERQTADAVRDCEMIFHIAANPEVRIHLQGPDVNFNCNLLATYNLLEAMRKSRTADKIFFTSTSAVYGEVKSLPISENYGPLKPISLYGASKLACENLIHAYCHTYGLMAIIFRLANIVGARARHGVVYDFVVKLLKNPGELEILGDGTQEKSYLAVEDCVEGIILPITLGRKNESEILNIGAEDKLDVKTIAHIVVEEMNLKGVNFIFSKTVEDGRGWIGDIKFMQLDISKLKSLGWSPKYNSKFAVRIAAKSIIEELKPHVSHR